MRTWRKRLLVLAAITLLLVGVGNGIFYWYCYPNIQRTNGVVYGERDGQPLTMDVLKPEKPNGYGVIFMVSGGWKSRAPGEVKSWMYSPLLRSGYTIFAVCHISRPKCKMPEIIEDVTRGVRFVRHHAKEYGIDPNHIGLTGGSAGGHLCLMVATRGHESHSSPSDDIDRESAEAQAVAIFYPVTDFLNMQGSSEDTGGKGPPIAFEDAFPPESANLESWKEIGHRTSPIYFINERMPPVLIHHGDSDTLVPLDQSERFRERARESGKEVKLVVHRGGDHGWYTMLLDTREFTLWFDKHLRGL